MLKEISFPLHRRFKSRTEWEPIGFFSDCLCNSTQFDLMLGFFSSSAISVLADGFAAFLYNGGKMRLVINDILSEQDKIAIQNGASYEEIPFFDLNDIEKLKEILSLRDRHFFECMSWLIRNDRLEIKIISPKDGIGISHTKTGVFCDGLNTIGFDGSCNFSRTALVDNIESLTASCDWDNEFECAKIKAIRDDFDRVFNEQDDSVVYVKASEIKVRITNAFENKSIENLLKDEADIFNSYDKQGMPKSVSIALKKAKDKIKTIVDKIQQEANSSGTNEDIPKFPYESGPREYQKLAFENWKANKQKGLFAMATGTGKTITSLNCLLEIYKHCGYYKAIILVPTITLVDQWEKECLKFNFTNVVKVCSKNNNWRTTVSGLRLQEIASSDTSLSYVIISTYASFARPAVFSELNSFPKKQILLIADEAHNMGSGMLKERLSSINCIRRIGLSATPERQFDDSGNRMLMDFFGCKESYTFEYSMRQAIENEALCRYYYYPHVVKLTSHEMNEYTEISKRIVKLMGRSDPDGQEILKNLLLKRKRIVHKAENKKSVFQNIVTQRYLSKGNLKYTLVYVPEGNVPDDQHADVFDTNDFLQLNDDDLHLINEYTKIVMNLDSHLVVRQFTSESKDRDDILKGFASGEIEVLTSMKCLDEGVDVPRSEFAIFCASTGNPRQFIQRRGRVLRTHPEKKFAIVHDLIVIPEFNLDSECYTLERGLVEGELKRVRDFASLSENLNDTDRELSDVLTYYKLSLFD